MEVTNKCHDKFISDSLEEYSFFLVLFSSRSSKFKDYRCKTQTQNTKDKTFRTQESNNKNPEGKKKIMKKVT